jgi:predicted DNA-binding transcriptional regulator AlpA
VMTIEPWLSRKQVAELIGVHPMSLCRLVARGQFPPPIKMTDAHNAPTRWTREDIEQWAASRRQVVDRGEAVEAPG